MRGIILIGIVVLLLAYAFGGGAQLIDDLTDRPARQAPEGALESYAATKCSELPETKEANYCDSKNPECVKFAEDLKSKYDKLGRHLTGEDDVAKPARPGMDEFNELKNCKAQK
jgi:hypothetical protein